jgi:hypothetical protein
MNKKLVLTLVLGFALGAPAFVTTQIATQYACDTVRKVSKLPSNDWIGNLDTPATPAQIDRYCLEKKYLTPSIVTIIWLAAVMGVPYACYSLLRMVLIAYRNR